MKKNKMNRAIELMPNYIVHIARLLQYDGKSAYSHSVEVPKKMLDGVDELVCTLDYPLEDPHTFTILLPKREFGGVSLIDVDELCLTVAKEYKALKQVKGFIFHVLSDLWIEGMRIRGNRLIVDIGS